MSARENHPGAPDGKAKPCPECGETPASPTWYRHARCGGRSSVSDFREADAVVSVQAETFAALVEVAKAAQQGLAAFENLPESGCDTWHALRAALAPLASDGSWSDAPKAGAQ